MPSAADANYAMTAPAALTARVAELERERKHLLAVIEILKEVSTSLHFIDILQAIARKLGEAFGLDRCSILLAERGSSPSAQAPSRSPNAASRRRRNDSRATRSSSMRRTVSPLSWVRSSSRS